MILHASLMNCDRISMAVFATDLDYWLNWRVFFCAIPLLGSILAAFLVLWKYEGSTTSKRNGGETQDVHGDLQNHDAWKPCLKQIHPLWLMVFRIVSFSLLLITLVVRLAEHGFQIYFFYTQWTFTLLAIYFALGSVLSIYGCYQHQKLESSGGAAENCITDEEQASYSYIPIVCEETIGENEREKLLHPQEQTYASTAGIWCRLFEVLFQTSAGAVMLTDCVYWFIIFPFMTIRDYPLNFMTVNVHSLNVVLLLGDTALNCLRLPWYRISYYIIWSGIFVIFQWIVHAFIPIWWPYPFLDLASANAPLWYLLMGLAHIPCYAVFVLIIQLKHLVFSKLFPHSYRCCK